MHRRLHEAGTKSSHWSRSLWRAVRAREGAWDGKFVYAVRSTGVYCRPSCPSRRPRFRQVLFFRSPQEAEQEGFRACLRCRPRETNHRPELALVKGVCRLIEGRGGERILLGELAGEAGVGRFRLERVFRRVLGISPLDYADAIRMRKLKLNLREGDDVTTALYAAGYTSPSRLYERSHDQMGMTPGTYRKGGFGMQMHYTIAASPLGHLLVAGTARGVSAIYIAESAKALEQALRKEYPKAQIRRGSKHLSRWVQQLVRHLKGQKQDLEIPLDVQATAFQRRVWQALQQIPYGETRSYSDISREIGKPRAARAVARACATNSVSVLIPCHRVVREGGALGGYRWGIGRKKQLLEQERRPSKENQISSEV